METKVHLAQVNVARLKAPLESPQLAGFVARLDEINALADESPGFVWRLQGAAGNATYLGRSTTIGSYSTCPCGRAWKP